jgi:type IV secretion system protein VirD4
MSGKLVEKPMGEDGHILVVGGAGSGKTSCIAIPTLKYGWKSPVLAVDIKGDLWQQSQRPYAYVMNPLDPHTMGYDPFYFVRQNSRNPTPDIRDIALSLIPLPVDIRDPFWIKTAQNILTSHLLYCFQDGASFTDALHIIQESVPKELMEIEAKNPESRRFTAQYGGLKEETLAGVMSELTSRIVDFVTDPDIQDTLNRPHIVTPDVTEEGYNVFLQFSMDKIDLWSPLVTLIVQQFLRHFERRPEGENIPVLFMLDEFPRLGKMESILRGLATLRSKKVTLCLIVQSFAQLDAIYGHDNRRIIADNCYYKAILGATDADTQAYLSRLVGTEERVKVTRNTTPSSVWDYIQSGNAYHPDSYSYTTEDKPKIKPEEFGRLRDEMILLTPDGDQRIKKMPYWTMGGQAAMKKQRSSQHMATAPRRRAGAQKSFEAWQAERQRDTRELESTRQRELEEAERKAAREHQAARQRELEQARQRELEQAQLRAKQQKKEVDPGEKWEKLPEEVRQQEIAKKRELIKQCLEDERRSGELTQDIYERKMHALYSHQGEEMIVERVCKKGFTIFIPFHDILSDLR